MGSKGPERDLQLNAHAPYILTFMLHTSQESIPITTIKDQAPLNLFKYAEFY